MMMGHRHSVTRWMFVGLNTLLGLFLIGSLLDAFPVVSLVLHHVVPLIDVREPTDLHTVTGRPILHPRFEDYVIEKRGRPAPPLSRDDVKRIAEALEKERSTPPPPPPQSLPPPPRDDGPLSESFELTMVLSYPDPDLNLAVLRARSSRELKSPGGRKMRSPKGRPALHPTSYLVGSHDAPFSPRVYYEGKEVRFLEIGTEPDRVLYEFGGREYELKRASPQKPPRPPHSPDSPGTDSPGRGKILRTGEAVEIHLK